MKAKAEPSCPAENAEPELNVFNFKAKITYLIKSKAQK